MKYSLLCDSITGVREDWSGCGYAEERATRDDSGYDRYQQQEEEEEDNSGAALMCDALDTLEQARQYMAEAEAKVQDVKLPHFSLD